MNDGEEATRALFLAGGRLYGALKTHAPPLECQRALETWREAVDTYIHPTEGAGPSWVLVPPSMDDG